MIMERGFFWKPKRGKKDFLWNDKEYKSYLAHARIYAESGNTLRNRTPFLSLPFYDTAEEHPTTQTILKGPAFIDLAWAGNCGLQGTYDLSNVSYASFSFSKMFGIQYHRIGILYSKTPIKHFEMYNLFLLVLLFFLVFFNSFPALPVYLTLECRKCALFKLRLGGVELIL